MRNNTPDEMAFQKAIVQAFETGEAAGIGFPEMLDVLMAWIVYTIKERLPGINRRIFIDLCAKTWNMVQIR